MSEQLTAIQKKLAKLSPANKLRLAAALIEERRYDIAEVLARDIADELAALQIVRRSQSAPVKDQAP